MSCHFSFSCPLYKIEQDLWLHEMPLYSKKKEKNVSHIYMFASEVA